MLPRHDLLFVITFHGPFHVGSGGPDSGMDRVLDHGVPLPGSSLKGLIRAEATERLGLDPGVIGRIFGVAGRGGSPWWWSDAQFPQAPVVDRSARIVIDDETNTAARGFLLLGEQLWARTGEFRVQQTRYVNDVDTHMLVLRAAARCVSSLGGDRRRGMGWVTISDTKPWTAEDTRLLRKVKAS